MTFYTWSTYFLWFFWYKTIQAKKRKQLLMYEFSPEPNSIFVCHTRWQKKIIIFFQWKWNIIADKSAWHHHSTSLHVGQTARQLAGNQLKLLASKHSSLRSSLFFATKSTWLTVKVLFSFVSFVAGIFLLVSFRLFWCNCILLWRMILGFFEFRENT